MDLTAHDVLEVSRCLIPEIADAVAAALSKEKEWSDALTAERCRRHA